MSNHPVFHGVLGTQTGAVIPFGGTALFLPCHTEEVLVVSAAAPLALTGPIPQSMRGYVDLDLTLRLRPHKERV